MRLIPTDFNLLSIFQKIEENLINLQPDFQRGEVWSDKKKKKLIDTILRNWHIPPIHIIEVKNNGEFAMVDEVLDGQQRLVAIRDFINGEFSIDGNIEPFNSEIKALDGKKYKDLNTKWKRVIDFFPIRMFQIVDYLPEEPSELFYRLNQPANLTAAEQRNAFYGPARFQIKELVTFLEEENDKNHILGFSNSRMAYDDVISKFCFLLEIGTMRKKITSVEISDKYRSQSPFSHEVLNLTGLTIKHFVECCKFFNFKIKFNKATFFSWLCFLVNIIKNKLTIIDYAFFGEFISNFEVFRNNSKYNNSNDMFINFELADAFKRNVGLILIFNQKASFSSTDVSSILTRDLIIWIFFLTYLENSKFSFKLDNKLIELKDHVFSTMAERHYWRLEDCDYMLEHFNWGFEI